MYKREFPNAPSPVPQNMPIPTSILPKVIVPSVDEINQQFLDAQDDREKTYERSRRDQRIAFLQAIAVQDDGQDRREKDNVICS